MVKLLYQTADSWRKFPAWADFFVSVGEFLAVEPLLNERTVVGISAPTREFAAVLSAAGVVKKCQTNPFAGDNAELFKHLCGLPKNTPVKCLFKNREKDAILLGCQEMHGEMRLEVQIGSPRDGNPKRFIGEQLCHEIKIAEENSHDSIKDLSRRKQGRMVREIGSFIREFLQNEIENSFAMDSSADCLLVGRKRNLYAESNETTFGCSSGNPEIINGKLQEVLRVRQFFSSEQPSHCEFISAQARRKTVKRNMPENVSITIFDGANGFLKLRDFCRNSHWIVLLDRTEPNFFSAVEQLNTDFSQRESDLLPDEFPALPNGLEAMFFTEKLR